VAFSAGATAAEDCLRFRRRNPHISFAAANDYRTIALHQVLGRVLINAQIAAPRVRKSPEFHKHSNAFRFRHVVRKIRQNARLQLSFRY
jgi:hypothetical protein